MRIEFDDSEYKYEYGKAPKGRGFWFFFFEGYEFGKCGTYAEAKKACKEYVKQVAPTDYVGTVTVKVGV